MSVETKPTKPFQYPGGVRMCAHGQIRAAEYARQVLSGEATAEEIEAMAQKGEWAIQRGADTHKRNLIAHIIFFLLRRGELEHYANADGDFVKNTGKVTNLKHYEPIAQRFRK